MPPVDQGSMTEATRGPDNGAIWTAGTGGQAPNETAFAALTDQGRVITWGTFPGANPVQADAALARGDIVDIYSNSGAFAAITDEGRVIAWGGRNFGGDLSERVDDLQQDVVQIYSTGSVLGGAFAALTSDGRVVAWGHEGSGGAPTAEQEEQLQSGVQAVYSNLFGFVAITEDGSVVSWGGEPSNAPTSEQREQLEADDVDILTIVSSRFAFAALTTDGQVIPFGRGPTDWHRGFGAVEDDVAAGVERIFATDDSFAALREDGRVFTWGTGRGADLAVSSTLRDVVDIQSTSGAFAALHGDGTVTAWGGSPFTGSDVGNDLGPQAARLVDSESDDPVVSIHSTGSAFAALTERGAVITWGRDNQGGRTPDNLQDELSEGVIEIISSEGAFAVIKDDGSVHAWGNTSISTEQQQAILDDGGAVSIYATRGAFAVLTEEGNVVHFGPGFRSDANPPQDIRDLLEDEFIVGLASPFGSPFETGLGRLAEPDEEDTAPPEEDATLPPEEDPDDNDDDTDPPPLTIEGTALTVGRLTLIADEGWLQSQPDAAFNASGATVEIRSSETGTLLLRVEDGSVVVSGAGVNVDGMVFGASVDDPIIDGSFRIDASSLDVTEFIDRDSPDSLRLGGIAEIRTTDLNLSDTAASFVGDLALTGQFQAIQSSGSLFTFRSGEDGLQLLPNTLSTGELLTGEFSSGDLFSDAGFTVTLSDSFLAYSFADNAVFLGGQGRLSWSGQMANQLGTFGVDQNLTLSLSAEPESGADIGSRFIRFQTENGASRWDIVGELSYSASATEQSEKFGPTITNARLQLDTIEQSFGGGITARLPILQNAILNGEYTAVWEPSLQLDSFAVSLSEAAVPLGGTGLRLTGGGISLSDLAGITLDTWRNASYQANLNFGLETGSPDIRSPVRGEISGQLGNDSFTGTVRVMSTIADLLPDEVVSRIRADSSDSGDSSLDVFSNVFGIRGNDLLDFHLLEFDGAATLDLGNGALSANLEGGFLNNTVSGRMAYSQGFQGDVLNIYGTAQVNLTLPDQIPLVGGSSLNGNAALQFSNDGDFSNDFVAAWTSVDIGFARLSYTVNAGIQVGFDGSFATLGREDIALIGSWELEPEMGVVILSAAWEETAEDAEIVVITPDNTRITEDQFADFENIRLVEDLSSPMGRHVAILEPEAGIWDIEVVSGSDLGQVSYSASNMLDGAELQILAAAFDATNETLDIRIEVDLNDQQDASLAVFAESLEDGSPRFLLGIAEGVEDGVSELAVSTLQLPPSSYRFSAELSGSRTAPVQAEGELEFEIEGAADIVIDAMIEALDEGGFAMDVDIANVGERSSGPIMLKFGLPEDAQIFTRDETGTLIPAEENSIILPSLEPGSSFEDSFRLEGLFEDDEVSVVAIAQAYQETWGNNQVLLTVSPDDTDSDDPEEDTQDPDPVDDPDDDFDEVRADEPIFDRVFFSYGFASAGNLVGLDIFLESNGQETALVLPEDQDGFFDEYLDEFARQDGQVSLIDSVFLYQEDQDGTLQDVLRLDAPEEGFQSIEAVLFAFLEATEGSGEDAGGNPDDDAAIDGDLLDAPDNSETGEEPETDWAENDASGSNVVPMEMGAFALIAFFLMFMVG